MRNDNSSSRVRIAQSMKRSHTDNQKNHKNTRKPIKKASKLVSFVQFSVEWLVAAEFILGISSERKFCSQHFSSVQHWIGSQGWFNRRPQSTSLCAHALMVHEIQYETVKPTPYTTQQQFHTL